jgi:ATP-dependent DNA ligase
MAELRVEKLLESKEWLHDLKWDGYRARYSSRTKAPSGSDPKTTGT